MKTIVKHVVKPIEGEPHKYMVVSSDGTTESGHAPAQYNIGVCYANGEGVKQDIDEAKRWWTMAAAKGDELAVEALAKEQRRALQSR